MKKEVVVGIMGPGSTATEMEIEKAREMGKLIAKQGWITLTGGSNNGVMNAALQGAKEQNPKAFTVGILSHQGDPELTSKYIDLPIPTGMGEGRNYLNIGSVDIAIICCNDLFSSLGTMSEFIFCLKHEKRTIVLSTEEIAPNSKELTDFYRVMTDRYCKINRNCFFTSSVNDAIEKVYRYAYGEY